MTGCKNEGCPDDVSICCFDCKDKNQCSKKCDHKKPKAYGCDKAKSLTKINSEGPLTAKLAPGYIQRHLVPGGQEANIKALKNAVGRLCLAATQNSAGQRKNNGAGNSVFWNSPEIDMCQYVILCEAVALVLSGKLDDL